MPVARREPLDPKISLWHFLAYYLRFMREKEGLSLTQWGRIIGAARSTVSNMEAGRHRLQEDHAKIIDGHFGTGRLIELILYYARMGHDPEWLRQFIHYEQLADTIRWYHGHAVPLPLQTDEYTWALVQLSKHKDLQALYAARLERKRSILDSEDLTGLWVLIDEGVLARPVGGKEVMRAQLAHLRKVADRREVFLRIVPFVAGEYLGFEGPVQIITMDGRDVAYSGAQGGGRLIEAPSEVKEIEDTFNRIGAKALSEDGSRDLIEQYLEKYP